MSDVEIEQAFRAVAERHGLALYLLKSRSRTGRVARARHDLMRRLHADGLSIRGIAKATKRSRATVLYAVRKEWAA